MDEDTHVLEVYGISQHPDTKDYIMVLAYAKGGNLQDWMNRNYKRFDWNDKLLVLADICKGLARIHQKGMVHRDFHTGNILFKFDTCSDSELNAFISDMGLSGEIGNMDDKNIYGVMPYVAPEVLRGETYTQAADVYSFGMIMYFVATGRQPFSDREIDEFLAIDICKELRPTIHEPEAPECYIDLILRCWDSNPENRPKMKEIEETIFSFQDKNDNELKEQFREAEKYRKLCLDHFEEDNDTNSQAIYKSRLLNHYLSDCLDCEI
jgi:serine/threonine protein kinase